MDALRGVAALMVVMLHFTNDRPETVPFKWGITGVDLFFIISGFVIFMSITTVKTGVEFVINRACRLYPAYWASVTFTFLMVWIYSYTIHQNPPLLQYFANMTMFQSWVGIHHLDSPYWTLNVEMLFYIIILLLFVSKQLRYINIIAFTVCILVLVMGSFFYHHSIVRTIIRQIPLLQFTPLFFAGVLFYKLYAEKTKLAERYLLIAFCLTCQILMYSYAGRSRDHVTQFEYAMVLTIYFSLFALFINHKLGFIINRVMLFLGKISYVLYLIHNYVSTKILFPLLIDEWHINYWVAAFAICLPMAILLAAFITYCIEAPVSKIMKSKLRRITGAGQ